jgi:hypothetical protein
MSEKSIISKRIKAGRIAGCAVQKTDGLTNLLGLK